MARRFGHRQHQQAVDQRRHRGRQEHPAPRRHAHPQHACRTTRGIGQPRIAQQRREDAQHDRQLLHRTEPATNPRGCHLGDIGGCDHRGHAHADAAHQAPHDQVPYGGRHARPQGRGNQQYGRHLHGAHATEAVGKHAGVPGAKRRAQQGARHGEADLACIQGEVAPDRIDRAVDHGRVETEQEATQCRGSRDQYHP